MFPSKVEPYGALGGVVRACARRRNDKIGPLFDVAIPHEDSEFNLGTVRNGMDGWAFRILAIFPYGRKVVGIKQALDS